MIIVILINSMDLNKNKFSYKIFGTQIRPSSEGMCNLHSLSPPLINEYICLNKSRENI